MPMIGRDAERSALDAVLDDARSGRSAALILRGDPGVGKTTLLTYAAERASDMRLIDALCVESEAGFAFAGLHQLCAPVLGRLDGLPGLQRGVLESAFGIGEGPMTPDPFHVALATLGLLSGAAREQPVLCVIDDAQWLDEASADVLALAGRRLGDNAIALLVATRESGPGPAFAGLPEMVVGGLGREDAGELLRAAIPGPLDARVRERLVAETRGNPRALLELPAALTRAELAGGFGAPSPGPASGMECLVARLQRLPAGTRRLLLVAAADPLGDPRLVLGAARRLGIAVENRDAADLGGLLELGAHVRFHHPLVRSATYQAATPEERRIVHEALAEVTDAATDTDHHVWHRAQAAQRPGADIADALERSADRAAARGGFAAGAAFLGRSAALTPDPALRGRRYLAAAQAEHDAGAPDAALELLARAEVTPLGDLHRARIRRLHARIVFTVRHGGAAAPLLLRSAKQLERHDRALARETYLDALAAALDAGRLAEEADVATVVEAIRTAAGPSSPPTATDLLLDGLAARLSGGLAAGALLIGWALDMLRDEPALSAHVLAAPAAAALWEFDAARDLAARQVEAARKAGALTILPVVADHLAALHVHAGRFADAAAGLEEAAAARSVSGSAHVEGGTLVLAAWRGDEQAVKAAGFAAAEASARGDGLQLTIAEGAIAVLNVGLGRHRTALSAAQHALQHDELMSGWLLPELIEAAVRSGEANVAEDALERLCRTTGVCGTDYALGMEARCRALLARGRAAEDLHRAAVDRLARTSVVTALARAHLLYGEWLRRERRRAEARAELRVAHEMFASMGADGFARRARRELRAAGERARGLAVQTDGRLTVREMQIARLAARGHTNPEIGAQLFISPRTVEYHLHKVFRKLSVTSRSELIHALPADAERLSAVPPAIPRRQAIESGERAA
jgi:DNA-binding CsgD family transcriptional regulator